MVPIEGTVIVQKALSAIKRADEKVSISTTIEILRGTLSDVVKKNKYNELKTFGVGRDISIVDWVGYIEQMLRQGILTMDENEHFLKITEDGTAVLKGKKEVTLTKEVIVPEDSKEALLYKRLKGLRIVISNIQNVPPHNIFTDKILHELARIRPVTVLETGSIYGIGVYKMQHYCLDFVKIIRQFKGLSTEVTDDWTKIVRDDGVVLSATSVFDSDYDTIKRRKSIRVNGIQFEIDPEIQKCIEWSSVSNVVRQRIRWNFRQVSLLPLIQLIPAETEKRDMVVKRFSEIVEQGYGLTIKEDAIVIPQRIEYDYLGNVVQSLSDVTFDEALAKFVKFVEDNGHYPYANSGPYESSLLRWYQEIKHYVVPVTMPQMLALEDVDTKFEGLPRYDKTRK